MNLKLYLHAQRRWSATTFGPGPRTLGIIAHIRKELTEIEAAPDDVEEWIDVAILALDGAWRAGHSPEEICAALERKQAKNFARKWPEPGPQDQPTEHVRELRLPGSDSPHSWPEDFAHENGNYENSCIFCEAKFIGHKRRVICKVCDRRTTYTKAHHQSIAEAEEGGS